MDIFNHFNPSFIIISIFPFIWNRRNNTDTFQCFFSILISNCILILIKSMFRVPHHLNPNTFAFPSGHVWMIVSTTYFCLYFILNKYYYIFTFIFAMISAYNCLYFNYHTLFEVVSGFVLSIIFCIFIHCYNKKFYGKKLFNCIIALFIVIFTFFCSYVLSPKFALNNIYEQIILCILMLLFFFTSKELKHNKE